MSRMFDQKIVKHENVQYISNQIGLLNSVINSELIQLEDGTTWVKVAWESTASGKNLIFENVDNLSLENGCYDFNKQKWNNAKRINVAEKRFVSKLQSRSRHKELSTTMEYLGIAEE